MADRIVYGQKDFDKALFEGFKSVTLCAGIYVIPRLNGAVFNRLGPVKVSVECTKREAEKSGMVFCDIYPTYKSEHVIDYRSPMASLEMPSADFNSNSGSGGAMYGSYSHSSISSCCGCNYILGYGIDLI